MYRDRDGQEISQQEFLAKVYDWSYTVVGKDTLYIEDEKTMVLTIWLGLGAPNENDDSDYIFQTAVFGGELSGFSVFYSNEFDAFLGHIETVEKVKTYANERNFPTNS